MVKKGQPNEKSISLQKHNALHPHPETVEDEMFREGGFFDPQDLVQVKYEMLRRVHKDRQSISQAAKAFGFSRPSFYQCQTVFEKEGLAGLLPERRGPQSAHKLKEEVMHFVDQLRQNEEFNSRELAERVEKQFGFSIHPRTIERGLEKRKKKPRRLPSAKQNPPNKNGPHNTKP